MSTSSFCDDTLSPFDSTQATKAVGHPEGNAPSVQLLGSEEQPQGMSPNNLVCLQTVSPPSSRSVISSVGHLAGPLLIRYSARELLSSAWVGS